MERSNQPPKTECCREEGPAGVAAGDASRTTSWKRTQGTSQAASGCRTPLKLSSPETIQHAGGDAVASAEPNTEATVRGEVAGDLPGSQRVAREERADGNLGRPEATRRANCGSQSGRNVQRQEERSESNQGIRSVHSSQPNAGEGTDTITQPVEETSAVRTTDQSWTTSLRAIANKAVPDKAHRFGGLYGLLNQANLRECFYQLRKEAAPGVDGVTFEEYEKNLDENLRSPQTLRFGRGGGGHNGRFDFLGFEFRWEKSRTRGHAIVKRRTSRKKLRGAVARFTEWIRESRHEKVSELMKSVADKHRGHWNYYGVIGNSQSLGQYRTESCRALFSNG